MRHIDSWSAFVSFWQTMQHEQQRHLLVLPECSATYELFLPVLAEQCSLPAIGINLAQQVLGPEANYIKPNQAKQMLGLNRGLLVYRAVEEFNVSAFSALCGTLVGGSAALLIIPAGGAWQQTPDQQERDFGWQEKQQTGAFKIWWQSMWQANQGVVYVASEAQFEACDLPLADAKLGQAVAKSKQLNQEQKHLLDSILSMATGASQVIWATGPRGRGKSFAVDAALTLLQAQGYRCLITASANHCSRLMAAHSASYYAVDSLLADASLNADVLVVEEASSMPLALLEKLLQRFAKLVLVATVDGYEGTGQGLSLKLPGVLARLGLVWQRIELQQPLRWHKGDYLEHLIEQSFLPRQLASLPLPLKYANLQVRIVKAADLLAKPDLLAQAYALLALAHYQTTPQDLRLLLDYPDLTLHLLIDQLTEQLCGVVCVMHEGQFEPQLAQQVARGNRRVKGQLLPQILAQQAGIASFAETSILRVQRIAVHPLLQGQGLGSLMLQRLKQWAQARQVDYLGASFAAEPGVIKFWCKAGYLPVWSGLRADAASGLPSLQVLLPMPTDSQGLLALRQHWFFYSQLLGRMGWQSLLNQVMPTYQGIALPEIKQMLSQVSEASGNVYAIAGYVLQWLLQQPRLSVLQQQWLDCFAQLPANHKLFVQLTRALIRQDRQALEVSLSTGLLALKVEHRSAS